LPALAEGEGPPLTDAQASLPRLLSRQLDQLEQMVDDLLETSRVQAGDLHFQIEDVDARSLVHETVEVFRQGSAGHQLEASVPAEAVRVLCDRLRMLQVMTNLVGNALKYSPIGGRITVAVGRDAAFGVVSVPDEGIGIPADEVSTMFEPFRRTRRAAACGSPGIGLGLFVARRIVQAHGRLDVESPGSGSTFLVRVPLAATPAKEASPIVSAASQAPS
jgi:signal transduction histidine kinase